MPTKNRHRNEDRAGFSEFSMPKSKHNDIQFSHLTHGPKVCDWMDQRRHEAKQYKTKQNQMKKQKIVQKPQLPI